MSNELARFEQQLEPLLPRFEDILNGSMPVARLKQTLVVSCESNPALLECNRQSLMAAAMGASLLRLPCDGVTGQLYLIPFKGKVSLVPGFGGLITLSARSSFSVHRDIVREGDEFDLISGSEPKIHHKYDARLKAADRGKPDGAYALFRSHHFPTVMRFMQHEEIMACSNGRNVWKTHPLEMYLKTPIRHVAKLIPYESASDLRLAVALEEQHDLGRHAEITEEGTIRASGLDDFKPEAQNVAEQLDTSRQPVALYTAVLAGGVCVDCKTIDEWCDTMIGALEFPPDKDEVWDGNQAILARIRNENPEAAQRVVFAFKGSGS